MDIFGNAWENHAEKIAANWCCNVDEDDLVIVAGDISWAMQLPEALADLGWVAALPGRKLLVRGNHDYWWSSISKVRAALPPGLVALQNDHFIFEAGPSAVPGGGSVPERMVLTKSTMRRSIGASLAAKAFTGQCP